MAAVAQRAVLPTPPARLGDLHIDARYVPAESEALIGGDLYVVQSTPYGIRVMVGDVRGKGLGAVSAVSGITPTAVVHVKRPSGTRVAPAA